MNFIKIVQGDLLNSTEEYILHQCNCVSVEAKTLAKLIFDKFPHANTYIKRQRFNKSTFSKPATFEILGDGINEKYIINLYSQYYPAQSKLAFDSKEERLVWFKQGLNEIAKLNKIKNIAMPYNIGCGAAGGNWNDYYKIIEDFSNNNKINITLYKLNN